MGVHRHICFVFLCVYFPTKVWGKYCDGGLLCTPPKECCSQGCCYVYPPPGQKPSVAPEHNAFKWFINEHWYFWISAVCCLAVLALCSLWSRRRTLRRLCLLLCGRRDGAGAGAGAGVYSDRDSAGSCYLPPQYSRCSSFHHAPPPYTEVTSKPDMYPLVITYGDNADKGGASYLMVHYFRNYIIRPSGSLSATSTADSLSSSFICNASNEANTIIPPPYSSTGNFEEWRNSSAASSHRQAMLRSFSSLTCSHQAAAPPTRSVRQSASTQFRIPAEQSPDSNDATSGWSIQTTAIRSPTRDPSEDEVFYSEQRNNNPRGTEGHKRSSRNRVASANSSYADGSLGGDGNRSPGLRFIFNDNNHTSKPISNRIPAPPDSLVRDNQAYSGDARKHNVQSQFWFNNLQKDLDKQLETENKRGPPRCYLVEKSTAQNVICNDDNNSYRNKIIPESSRTPFHRRYDLESPIFNDAIPINTLCQIGEDNVNIDYSIYQRSIDNGCGISSNYSLHPNLGELRTSYISITGSDISSLANISTPNSPPRATSPTSGHDLQTEPIPEPKTHCDFTLEASSSYAEPKTKRFFGKGRKSSLYMPLSVASNSKMILPGKVSPTSNVASKCTATRKGWLSRSAPTTPCGNGLFPNLMTVSQKKMSSSGSSKHNREEDSPLLAEQECTDDRHVEF